MDLPCKKEILFNANTLSEFMLEISESAFFLSNIFEEKIFM
jgi:hypothetical protein